MTEYTPSTGNVKRNYCASRTASIRDKPERLPHDWDLADAEFERWLSAHDQGIRDAVKPPAMTAREHLEAAFEAAYPVPEWRDVPAGVTIIARRENGKIWVLATGWTSGAYDPIEVRTLEPLPPLIPKGTPAVWASAKDCDVRRVLVLSEEPIGDMPRHWRDGDGDEYRDEQLIDPVPIPKEGDR